jgi:ParB family transcriptional regulator, chromosome partitioning protein
MSAERSGKGLGMGLSALLGESAARSRSGGDVDAPSSDGVREIEVSRIRPNPDQPRSQFGEEGIAELARSIAERGLLQPILVRPDGDGFMIVAGERRWRAAQKAQVHTIPAIVRDLAPGEVAEVALIENVQREDLNAIEEAEAYRQLMVAHGHTQDGLAKIVHKSRSHIANLLRLLDLPEFVRQSLLRGDISMGHARAVASAPDPEALVRAIIAKGWSVRKAEEEARSARPSSGPAKARKPAEAQNPDLAALERQLGDMLGLKVEVSHKGEGGTVRLTYSTLDQLDMICQRLTGEPI